jgi:hypothetical protein
MMFQLTGSLICENSRAVLGYQGVNRGQVPFYVSHLPLDVEFGQYPNSAYTSLSVDCSRLHLVLGASPLPTDEDVEFSVGALSVRVEPGALISGEVRLPLPADEWNAYYFPAEGVGTEIVLVDKLVLMIDVIPVSAVAHAAPVEHPTGYWSVVGPASQSLIVLRSDRPLPVRKRLDNFPRS